MRKVATILALPAMLACLLAAPAHAADTVGGARLKSRGYIWDRASHVAEPPHIQASSYVVADLETGAVLAAKDPHGHYRPASTLKTLTAITLIPRLDPKKKVRPSVHAVDASGSAVGLDVRWDYTVNDLFHGLLMQSGNDTAIALAEAYGGLPKTLAAMNAEAHRIRADDTVARTTNGLDDDPPLTLKQQHSSAYDLALIMKQGLTLPDFRKYVGAKLYKFPAPPTKAEKKKGKKNGDYEIGTHDHLIVGDRYPGMIGGKNGWTSHALGSFVGAATRGGHTIIIALMHAQSDFWGDARSLLNWGFAERSKVSPVGTLVDPIPPPPTPTPKPKAAAKRVLPVDGDPSGGFAWWQIGLPVAALAIIGGVAIGWRRRLAGAGADSGGGSGDGADPGLAPRPLPPGDVKVAGSPSEPSGRSASPSTTNPGPVRPGEKAARSGPAGASPGEREASDDVARWTVRIPPRDEPAAGDAERPAGRDASGPLNDESGAESLSPPPAFGSGSRAASSARDDEAAPDGREPVDALESHGAGGDRSGPGAPATDGASAGDGTARDERRDDES